MVGDWQTDRNPSCKIESHIMKSGLIYGVGREGAEARDQPRMILPMPTLMVDFSVPNPRDITL